MKPGDCGESARNYLPIVDNWNILMRIYETDLERLGGHAIPTPRKFQVAPELK
jgi:hypothetical protein